MTTALAPDKKIKKEKEILLEFDMNTKDLRQQLNEQMKCLDQKVDTEFAILTEIQDYFKKRSEVEMEYSRSLDKIVRNIKTKHKNEKSKRDHWHLYSPYACWQNLLERCKEESKNHAALSDLYLAVITSRISQIVEDNQRIHKRCKEIGLKCHEEMFKVLNELNTAMKSYHLYNTDFKIAEQKLKLAESQMNKIEIKDKITSSKKKIISKTGRRQEKFNRNKLKVERSRNEYLLSLAAANTTIHRYYQEDLNDLIDCSSIGFLPSLSGTLHLYLQGEDHMQYSLQEGIRDMMKSINGLDAKSDKQHFLQLHNSPFQLPNKITFQNHRGDLVNTFVAEPEFAEELSVRHKQLTSRLTGLRTENDEVWKTLETAEATLLSMINQACQYNVASLFGSGVGGPSNNTSPAFARSGTQTSASFYGSQLGSASGTSLAAQALAANPASATGVGVSPNASAATTTAPDAVNSPVTTTTAVVAANTASPPSVEGIITNNSSLNPPTPGSIGSNGFGMPNGGTGVSAMSVIKNKTDRQETEEFYLKKFREYLLSGDLISRLQAKFIIIHHGLQELGNQVELNNLTVPSQTPKKKRFIGQGGQTMSGQRPKLFGGSLEEYILATGQDIPLIMLSTIRVINLYGLHHQGIFRVSGSQIEINEFKNAFEKGEDPLVDVKDSRDINSVAGVLKLYFRELREPLFPIYMFDQLVGLGSKIVAAAPKGTLPASHESLAQLRDLLATLSKPVYVAMRYLFAFLNHLSEYSDENMMDAYNLAVCFGPTLLPVPSDRDQVQYQASVNELMRVVVARQAEIFPVAAHKAKKGGGEDADKVVTNAEYGTNDFYQNEGPFYDKYLVYNEEEEEDDDSISHKGSITAPGLCSTRSFNTLPHQPSSTSSERLRDGSQSPVKAGGSFKFAGEGGNKHFKPTVNDNDKTKASSVNLVDSDEEISELSATESSEFELPDEYGMMVKSKSRSSVIDTSTLPHHRSHGPEMPSAPSKHGNTGKSKVARDLTAVARFKFKARNEKELTFSKGDAILLKYKVSPEWWKGVLLSDGTEGLVPHRYLLISNDAKSVKRQSSTCKQTSKFPPPIPTCPASLPLEYKTRSNSDTSLCPSPLGVPAPSDFVVEGGGGEVGGGKNRKSGRDGVKGLQTFSQIRSGSISNPPHPPSGLLATFHLLNRSNIASATYDTFLTPLLISSNPKSTNATTKAAAVTIPSTVSPSSTFPHSPSFDASTIDSDKSRNDNDSDTLKLSKARHKKESPPAPPLPFPPPTGRGNDSSGRNKASDPPSFHTSPQGMQVDGSNKRHHLLSTAVPDLVYDLPHTSPPLDLKFIDDGYDPAAHGGTVRRPSLQRTETPSGSDGDDKRSLVIVPPQAPVNKIIKGFERMAPPTATASLSSSSTALIKPALRVKPAFLKKSSIMFDDDDEVILQVQAGKNSFEGRGNLSTSPTSTPLHQESRAPLTVPLKRLGHYENTNQLRKRPEETDL